MVRVIGFDLTERETTCTKCRARLVYTERDVGKAEHVDYGGGREIWRYIKCANCFNRVEVK